MRKLIIAETADGRHPGRGARRARRNERAHMGARSDRRHARFIAGRPIFGTLIALIDDGWPLLGIIDQPATKGAGWASAGAADPVQRQARRDAWRCRDLDQAILATTSPALFGDDQLHAFEHLDAAVMSTVLGGDCYNYGCVAQRLDGHRRRGGLKLHDFAALVPIVEGAGGRMRDWQGDPLHAGSNGEVVAAGDPARIDDILEALACRGRDHGH